ncbi:MAG: TonB-dependent receptor, partial [Rhodocyclaceae bacterium]
SVGGAIRFSDYSSIGKTTTWKVNGLWAVNDAISFRGTYSQAVRAPNIGELFSPAGQDFQRIDDPCAALNVNNGSSSRQANCLALLTSLGVANPGNYIDPNSATVAGFLGGNKDLREETAKTWTAGLVLQPVPRLRVALDWYNIKLTNAISTPPPQDLAELCVDQPTLDNQFCAAITREPGSGKIVECMRIPRNVARWNTAGLDLTLDYSIPTDNMGMFSIRLVGGYLDKLETISMPGAEPENERGQPYRPKFVGNLDLTWEKGPFTVNYGLAWFSKTYRFDYNTMQANPDITEPKYKKYKERARHDIYASYTYDERFKLFGGIRNFTNQKPDVGSLAYPIDAVGRFFFLGVEAKLENLF